ncbi:MAG: glycerophosphodiester phosphodiesterase family protein [Bacteroidota bacterium]
MAASDRFAQPDGFDVQGHRGARGLVPENTIVAFIKALELGVTTLELDAVITQDGEVLVSHEPWFSPSICSLNGEPIPETDERTHNIYAMTYDQTRAYDCGLRGNPRFPQQQPMAAEKPLLRDVIRTAEAYVQEYNLPPIFYNIETKSTPEGDGVFHPAPGAFTERLYGVIKAEGVLERATIQSFDPRTLRAARALDPNVRLALLIAGPENDARAQVDDLGFVPDIYSPAYALVNAEVLATAHELGMQVIPWTVNTLAEMQALKDLGVDGVITDYPDLGVQLLE